jgi:toxin FitB
MTRYLLDTNVVSELRKNKPHGAVVAWFSSLQEDQIYLSAVTMGELQAGIELTRQQDAQKARAIEAWVDQLEATFRVLPVDGNCFREWARLMHGKSDHLIEDGLIAATARVHQLTVATRNERDFKLLTSPVLNPFKA